MVASYRVVLYLLVPRIAIEIDEFGHRGRAKLYEMTREAIIKQNLGCRLIRVNPNDTRFNLAFCLSEVARSIFNVA